MARVSAEIPARVMTVQGEELLEADEVAAMVRLHGLGWGAKRLSKEFGCARRNTVRRYLRPVARCRLRRHRPRRRLMDWKTGCENGSSGTTAMPM